MENYDIISTIGRGGSGKVFLVRSKEDQRQYALKQILLTTKSNTKESVLKEARILSKLKHPHIVTCYNFFFDDLEEHLYILQDYCDGGNLQDQIFCKKEKHANIKEEQIMQWFVQVTMAVQHIHANKILHRDLKAQNIFLTKRDLVKIGDFGIAKVMENTLDMAETCCGTPCYLSPELCQDVPYTSKADIWALGCLLYELCSLRPAFSAGNIVSLFYKIVSGNVEPIPTVYSEDVGNLISHMMSKSPDDRPSAGAILNIPFVKDHLSLFIEGKESLKEKQRPSEDLRVMSSSNQRCSSRQSKSPVVPEELSCPDYPDDFEASSDDEEAEYSDDFDEGEGDESLKEPMAAKTGGGLCKVDVNVESYSDEEFEQDSDSESLRNILASAKVAQDLEIPEETVEDYERPSSSCRDIIREGCISVLGEKGFNEVKELCQNGKKKIEDHPGRSLIRLRQKSLAAISTACAQAVYFVSTLSEVNELILEKSRSSSKICITSSFSGLKIGIVGCGRLGKQLGTVLQDLGVVNASNLYISTRCPENLEEFQNKGVHCCFDNVMVGKTVDILFLCCLPSQLNTVSKDLHGNVTGLVYSFVAGMSLARITRLLDCQNIVKPNLQFNSDVDNIYEDLNPWKFGKDIKELLADPKCILHTCPLYSEDNSLLEEDVKLAESYVVTVLNECTRYGIDRDEAMRICNSTLFLSENSSCLDVQNILMNDLKTNMDEESPSKVLPVFDVVKMASEETLLEKKMREDDTLRAAFTEKYQKRLQKYFC